ncbi:MAG: carboxymuconolactone decarboxylase family protein [Candidatus Acidiferrales bacterium]
MKLLATATIVAAFTVLASGRALAQPQAANPSVSETSQTPSPPTAQTIQITRRGTQASFNAPAEHFTGSVRVDPLFDTHDPSSHATAASVTFAPGARTAWHSHPLGQTLIVTAGKGWVQQWRGPIEEIRQGDVVWIPPGVKHWHGATATTSMTHIGIQESLNGKSVEWMEKVSDAQCGNSQSTPGGAMGGTKEPSAAQKLFGDFDPKLAELTDNVLFGDVWQRPGLSQRDRSLITVAALIALNRPEQLRAHLQRARANGVTKDEVVEVITHLAFYAGWPNAINAIAVAKEVY